MKVDFCFKCFSIEGEECMLGKNCEHYDKANFDAEIERRRKDRAEWRRKRAEEAARRLNSV